MDNRAISVPIRLSCFKTVACDFILVAAVLYSQKNGII